MRCRSTSASSGAQSASGDQRKPCAVKEAMEKAKREKEEAEAAGVEPAVRRPVPWEETAMNAATYGKMTPQQIEQELKQAASPQHGPIAMR